MRLQKKTLCLPFLIMMILSACSSTNPLEGSRWVLFTLNDGPVLPEAQITLQFREDQLTGSDGCNTYSASYTANSNGNLQVDPNVISTMMACADPVMQQASEYTSALTQAVRFQVDEQILTLFDQAGNSLAAFMAQNSDLSGTSWLVTGYNNGRQAVVSVLIGSEITAEFNPNGKLSGSAGCNQYTAVYETQRASIQIGLPAATRKMCAEPSGVMDQEAQYLNALQTAASYHLEGDRLDLRTLDGALAVSLVRSR